MLRTIMFLIFVAFLSAGSAQSATRSESDPGDNSFSQWISHEKGLVPDIQVHVESMPDAPCDPDTGECWGDGYNEGGGSFSWSAYQNCKTASVWAGRKTWWGHRVWQYIQTATWCWNGQIVTSMDRYRRPADVCCFWQFSGHVSTNCVYENCRDKRGHYTETLYTTGRFRYCMQWCASEVNPTLRLTLYGNGGWAYAYGF